MISRVSEANRPFDPIKLTELKESFRKRMVDENTSDWGDKLQSLVDGIVSRSLKPHLVGPDFGLDYSGLDVPKTTRFVNLRPIVAENEIPLGSTYSACIGMKPSPKDPPEIVGYRPWAYTNFPEPGSADKMNFRDKCSSFTKIHLIVPNEGDPFLFIYPTQDVNVFDPKGLGEDGYAMEVAQANDDEKTIRLLKHQQKLYRENEKASVFRHTDRRLAMYLPVLEIARAMGIKDISLPDTDLFLMDSGITTNAREEIRKNPKSFRFIRRYDEDETFLKNSPDFHVFRWDGRIESVEKLRNPR